MQFAKRLPFYFCIALLIYMPFHIFLSQSLSLLTGGLEAWKIAKDLLAVCMALFAICLVWGSGKGTRLFWWIVGLTVGYALLHGITWLLNPDIYPRSAQIGSLYNIRVPGFLILGYSALLLTPELFKAQLLAKIILITAVIVAVLGIIQYFLPKDILTHVGYGLDRGVRPHFFIDDKAGFPRSMSTLRDPNSFGAYLVVPLALATALLLKIREQKQRLLLGGAIIVMGVALIMTFSRSAWIAAALSVLLVVLGSYHKAAWKLLRQWWWVLVLGMLAVGVVGYTQRHSTFVVTYITHSSTEEVEADLDSNDYHWLFVKQGIEGIVDTPLGHGPGTAGLASIQNPKGSFLTENYYVQLGYEIGIIGLLVFIALQIIVYVRLWRLRSSLLGLALLASFWGYVVMNMLLHTWSNEAVALQWWLLAGMVLGTSGLVKRHNQISSSVQKSR